MTLANLKAAQERYQRAIIELLPAPDAAQPVRVLDVGCGTGELSKALKAKGYAVEGLSPDINHVDSYATKVGTPFHHCLAPLLLLLSLYWRKVKILPSVSLSHFGTL